MKHVILIFCLTAVYTASFGQKKAPLSTKQLYEKNCQRCHGTDGTKGSMGAKNLQTSVLATPEIQTLLQQGKKAMPAYGKKLSAQAINELAAYVKTLRR